AFRSTANRLSECDRQLRVHRSCRLRDSVLRSQPFGITARFLPTPFLGSCPGPRLRLRVSSGVVRLTDGTRPAVRSTRRAAPRFLEQPKKTYQRSLAGRYHRMKMWVRVLSRKIGSLGQSYGTA